jgi:hypothetical protein
MASHPRPAELDLAARRTAAQQPALKLSEEVQFALLEAVAGGKIALSEIRGDDLRTFAAFR